MVKVIVRETIIILLLCLAIILILGVVLYNYVPTNKILPEQISYKQSEEVKSAIEESEKAEDSQIVLTYTVDSTDLDNYQKSKDYKPGKANPFSAVGIEEEKDTQTTEEKNQTSSENKETTETNTTDSQIDKNTTNSLFPDKGTK